MDLTIPPSTQTADNNKLSRAQKIALDYKFEEPAVDSEANKELKLLSTSSSFSQQPLNTTASQITEEDFLKIKDKCLEADLRLSTMEKESIISNADSVSNFDEHNLDIPYDDTEEEGDEPISIKNNENGKKLNSYGNFIFGRNYAQNNLSLNPETVRILNYPFEPLMVPNEEERAEYVKCFTDSQLFLVGTAHFSVESQQDVMTTIQQVQPDAVMVELCASRISILSMDEETLLREARLLTFDKMLTIVRHSGVLQGILHILLLSSTAHITRELGMAPGGEFRAAQRATQAVQKCRIILGDRPINITLQRALNALSFFQKIRLFFYIMASKKISITKEDVERCKNKDLLEELLKEMAGEFPQLTKIFVEERDLYMVHILRTLMQKAIIEKWNTSRYENIKSESVNFVAVVGIGHFPGMLDNWNRQFAIDELISIPKTTRFGKAKRIAVSILALSTIVYCGYKIAIFSYGKISNLIQRNF